MSKYEKRNFDPQINEYEITTGGNINAVFAFVSDLHGCQNAPVIDKLKSIAPDGILVAGDFVHNNKVYTSGIDFLRDAVKIAPVICSLGNHEMKCGHDVAALVNDAGAVLLDDSSMFFCGVNIGGLTSGYGETDAQGHFKKTPEPNVDWLNEYAAEEGYKVLLSHHPEYYEKYIRALPIDLTLSGHAHGGQWRIGDRGVYAPGQGVFPKYTSGLYDGRLLVNRGLGNPHYIPRINNAPEVIVIKFR